MFSCFLRNCYRSLLALFFLSWSLENRVVASGAHSAGATFALRVYRPLGASLRLTFGFLVAFGHSLVLVLCSDKIHLSLSLLLVDELDHCVWAIFREINW